MSNTTLFANLSSSIGDAFAKTVGVNSSLNYLLVGVVVLLIFLYWIWSSNLGIYGMLVIIPALIGVLAFGSDKGGLGLISSIGWIDAIIWIILAIVWALIIMRLVGER